MSRFNGMIKELAVSGIVMVIGWLICMTVLVGWYVIGQWAAPHLGWTGDRAVFGVLSVLAFIWIYEHREIETKYERLHELLQAHQNSN